MDDIFKVFGGVVVGFILSPLSEVIKHKVTSRQNKNKLLLKVKTQQNLLKSAIPMLDQTIKKRQEFINNPFNFSGYFSTPNLNFPSIEPNLENSYDSLSEFQRERLQILLSQFGHAQVLHTKIVGTTEALKELFKDRKVSSIIEVRELEADSCKSALKSEIALLTIALHCYNNTVMILENKDQSKNEEQLLSQAISKFKITCDKLVHRQTA